MMSVHEQKKPPQPHSSEDDGRLLLERAERLIRDSRLTVERTKTLLAQAKELADEFGAAGQFGSPGTSMSGS
jgi:hypothetical protein